MTHAAGTVETTDATPPGGELPDVRLRGLTKRYGDFAAVDAVDPVSYTHLTLPTTPYV